MQFLWYTRKCQGENDVSRSVSFLSLPGNAICNRPNEMTGSKLNQSTKLGNASIGDFRITLVYTLPWYLATFARNLFYIKIFAIQSQDKLKYLKIYILNTEVGC